MKPPKTPGFHIRKSPLRRRWWVILVGNNGKTLSHSEQLNSEAAAEINIAAQRKIAATAQVHRGG